MKMTLVHLSQRLQQCSLVILLVLPLLYARPLYFRKEKVAAASKSTWATLVRTASQRHLYDVDQINPVKLKWSVLAAQESGDLIQGPWPGDFTLHKPVPWSSLRQYFQNYSSVAGPQRHLNHSSLHTLFKESGMGTSLKSMSCTFCKLVLIVLHVAFASDWSEDKIIGEFRSLCIFLKEEDERVCDGIVHMFKAEVLTVFDSLVLSPDQVCGLLLGPKCSQTYNPFSVWNITLPNTVKPPVVPPSVPKPDAPRLRVLHLTDIHMDALYTPKANAICHEPLCCRADDGEIGPFPSGAGQFGDYRGCDTPLWTLHGLFSHLQTQQFDYIMLTGDLPPHNVWNQSKAEQTQILYNLTALLDSYFPGKPVFPALGNHESSPVNSFPPRSIIGDHSISWLYDALAESWRFWLPADALETVRMGAYYTVTPFPGFRIVSLNSNACNNMNWWLYLNTTDPDQQLAWLIDVLQKAENAKEKVHIVAHIPPGEDDCLAAWSQNYYKIIDRYESTITGQFFGHTHFDHFEIFYDLETLKRPTSVAYITPSITPFSGLNLGYRIFTVDGNHTDSTWAVLDHETYIMNLTAANLGVAPPQWEREYGAKTQYNMKSLFPQDWEDLVSKMHTDDNLFQQYYLYYHKSNVDKPCDSQCKHDILCEARTARSGSHSDFCPVKGAPRRQRKRMC